MAAALTQDARASGDYGCDNHWSLKRRQLDPCSNVPFLSPTNDSLVNLVLVLADRGRIGYAAEQTPSFQSDYGLVPFGLEAFRAWEISGGGENGEGNAGLPARADGEAGATASFARGEGSRCRTNTDDAARTFVAQVTTDADVPEAEQQELERSRRAILGSCSWSDDTIAKLRPADIRSARGLEFAAYVNGVVEFYAASYDDARRHFESLHESTQPWLRETAQYMLGRTELNRAQQHAFDRSVYPDAERVDRPALEASLAAFAGYLHDHPTGLYAASAKGLLRRVYWLMNDRRRLGQEYAWFLANPDSPLRKLTWPSLAHEIDAKLLGPDAADVDDPSLVAVMDLMAMRERNPALRARLESQRAVFAAAPRLYEYLSSALDYYDGDPERALASLPKTVPDPPLDTVAFSQQTLRGLALEDKGDWTAARTHWRTLIPRATHALQREQIELALAMNCERSGRLADVFAKDSLIVRPEIRRVLLKHVAGPALLRKQRATSTVSGEPDAALFALLYKELTGGRYREFVADLALLPKDVEPPEPDQNAIVRGFSPAVFAWPGGATGSGYTCPSIGAVAGTLAKNSKDPVGLNCLGEFVLRNYMEGAVLGQAPQADELGGGPSRFAVKQYSRLEGYLRVMSDAKARPDDRAYAIYRALNCFAFSGYNHCGGQNITLPQRRQWFRTLKTRYAGTRWGRELEVFW